MKLSLVVFISFFITGQMLSQSNEENFLVLNAAELSINGETNVNTFSCALRKTHMNDTLMANMAQGSDLESLEGMQFSFPVEEFECGLEMMTEDFRELLEVEKHPQIIVRIEDIQLPEDCGKNYSGPVTATIKLFIANAEREQIIEQASIHQIRQKTIFTGSYETLMTSYNLVPPSRMFGAVQAKDQIEVQFSIQVKRS